ncbi:hypothetical protein [uncultured Gelidibacter sp.]|uniref:hypothetical protein n=1 Tax=uncultured Gelidibacter sp. TaxID=259318 RepID=UPI0026139101|nr:hypothetical protein [uncultured Gelidibacter sp.]
MMKKFIKKIIYYSLASFLVLSVLTLAVDKGLRKTNDDLYGDWNRLFTNNINDDIIIVGNSRAKVHFDPSIIEDITGYSSYNLGKDATNLFLQQPIINSILANAKPKYIVLSLDIGSFQKKSEIFEKEQYLPYLNKPYIFPILSQVDSKVSIERLFPLVKYRGQYKIVKTGLKSNLYPANTYTLQKGYFNWERSWNSDFDNFKKTMGENQIVLSTSEIDEGLTLLNDIIIKCRKRGVEVILCQTPRYKELYSYFPQKQLVDLKIENLAKESDVMYFDFSYLSIYDNKEMFYNASHLNSKGATILSHEFSILINENINN